MNLQLGMNRFDKLVQVIKSSRLTRALLRYRVLVAAEHRSVLSRELATVVDIGANRGQFSLAVQNWAPNARQRQTLFPLSRYPDLRPFSVVYFPMIVT